MKTDIEHLARAYMIGRQRQNSDILNYDEISDFERRGIEFGIRAILVKMKDPPERAIKAVDRLNVDKSGCVSIKDVFGVMIDTLLYEESEDVCGGSGCLND